MTKVWAIGLMLALAGCRWEESGDQMPSLPAPTSSQTGAIPGRVVLDEVDDISVENHQELMDKLYQRFPQAVVVPTDLVQDTHIYSIQVSPEQVPEVMDLLKEDHHIQHVEPSYVMQAYFQPNDPQYAEQWNMPAVRAETAWNYTQGRGITVAVVDTGIACEDRDGFKKVSDLQQTPCVPGWNFVENHDHAFDDHGHGTHVAGTIAQSTNNNIGVTGLAFRATLMPVKVLSGSGSGTSEDVADGIRWAADHGAQVINLSLGSSFPAKIQQDAIHYARSKGVVVVAAAGNDGGPVGYPAAFDGVIAVSATNDSGQITSFSSRGPQIDLGAPGSKILQQTICEKGRNECEQYAAFNGTSMASPHVAGAAALIMSLGINDPDRVELLLKEHARVTEHTQGQAQLYGAGLLDAGQAAKNIFWSQVMHRLAFLGLLTLLLHSLLKSRHHLVPKGWGYWLPAVLLSTGLFVLPLLGGHLSVFQSLAHPWVELDLELGMSWHQWLPLANGLVPGALTVAAWHVPTLRQSTAGVATGISAYLMAALFLGQTWHPWGWIFQVWMLAQAVLCIIIAHWNLKHHQASV